MLDITADPDYAMAYGSNPGETETEPETDSSSQLVCCKSLALPGPIIMATKLNAFYVFSINTVTIVGFRNCSDLLHPVVSFMAWQILKQLCNSLWESCS